MTAFEPPPGDSGDTSPTPPDTGTGLGPSLGPQPFGPPSFVTTSPVPLELPRRTHPLTILFEALAVFGGLLFMVSTVETDWLLVFSVVSSVSGLVALTVRWWFRTYTVTEDRLLLDEGVLRRHHRVVPYARLQQVNVTQELFHRPFSVAALDVETAGEGGSSSISLRVLGRSDAEALQAYVLERRRVLSQPAPGSVPAAGAEAETDRPPGWPRADREQTALSSTSKLTVEHPLGRMNPDDLVLAGVTHSAVLAVVAVYAVLLVPLVAVSAAGEGETALVAGLRTVGLLLGGGAAVATVTALVLMAMSLVGDWNWTLTEQPGDDLHVRRGLLEVRSQSVPRRRVQQVTIVDNPIRRALGTVAVTLHTAAMPGSHQATTVQVPLVRRSELDELLTALMGPAWVLPPLQPRPEAARWRALRRRALLLLVLWGGPVLWQPRVWWGLLPLVLLAWPWGKTAHRRAGLAVTEDRVVFASGVLHHRIDIAPRRRVQSTRTSTSPLQRRAGLATLHVDLAGTAWRAPLRLSARLFDVDRQVATHLLRTLPRP